MPQPVDPTVLRRKIAAHAGPRVAGPDPGPAAVAGFGRALRRAAAPFEGLGLALGAVTDAAGLSLEDAVAALPETGLVAALEAGAGAGARGLLALSSGLIDALVEVQTTGRVEAADLPPRPVTRIDEALVRDFVDLALADFARETGAVPGRDWPARMSYGSRVRDRGQINLLLPDGPYRLLSAELGFEGVARRARMALVLPNDPAGIAAAPASGVRAAPPPDAAWLAARTAMLDALRIPAEAVLMRLTRPLREVQALAVGDLLPFGPADLQEVALETPEGAVLAHGRLGQIGGRRALRLPGSPAAPAPAPGPEAAAGLPAGRADRGASRAAPPAAAADTPPPPAAGAVG